MVEKVLGVFNAEDGNGRSCVLFFTNNRIIVVSMERVFWVGLLVMVGIIAGFVILFVRNAVMFLVGLGIAVGVGISFILISRLIRRMSVWRFRKLVANGILKVGKNNFEIPYASVVGVENRLIKANVGRPRVWYMIPLPSEVSYGIVTDIATTSEIHSL